MKKQTVLDQIIDEAEPAAIPKPDETWTDAKESTWRRCLSLVKTRAFIADGTLHVRPLNVNEFGNVLNAHGLGYCEITKECLIYLNTHPGESIKFRRPRR